MIKLFRYLCLTGVAFHCVFGIAHANSAQTTGDAIVEFLIQPTPSLSKPLAPSETDAAIVNLMETLGEAMFTSDPLRLSDAIDSAKSNMFDPDWMQTRVYADDVLKLLKIEDDDIRKSRLIEFFDSYDADENWYLRSISDSLSAFLHLSTNQLLVGTERTKTAMETIPSELSAQVTSARVLASEAAMVLHGLQGNPDFMLEAASLQQTAKATIGEKIDRFELMTNFIFALNRARDYEGAAQVAELLLLEQRPENATPGVSEAYMAATFNEIGNYNRAEALARTSIETTKHAAIERRGNLELLVALSGQGKKVAAAELMTARAWKYSPATLLDTVDDQSILHAEALLAMHRDESPYALALMKRRADLLINQVQSANSTNIGAMLSSLENTRERQVEREGALQRETELRAVQLEQKTKLNRLLWVLIGGLTIAFNFLLAFLRYREKLNVKVQGLQEDALSAEKMKTEFLSVINHELRTPLNGIIGISDAMIHHASNPTLRAQAEAVQESGQLLFDLLDSLITMSTIEGNRLSLDKEEAKLSNTITREVAEWNKAAANKNLAFTHFIGSELNDAVIADHKRMRQSLRYLLSNAIRFTHAGRVHLHATGTPDADGHLDVTIIVADTGQGISDDVQSRLFKPFLQADATMTRKYGGAGLSLAIARKLARMMGGDLIVKSREGRGTEFTFTARLPLAHAHAQSMHVPANPLATVPVPALDTVEEPEAIIDLMLGEQLLSARPDNTSNAKSTANDQDKNRYKATG